MSLAILTHIICDGCGDTFGVDLSTSTGTQLRIYAKHNDWVYSGNKDYCPECRKSKMKQPLIPKQLNEAK
jgi:hypothetical protein